MKIIVDACSIILLAKASVLETCTIEHTFIVTKPVSIEVLEGKKHFFADALLFEKLMNEKKIKVESADVVLTDKFIQDFTMGKGEASTLAFALKQKENILIATDNKQGRKAAQINGLPLIGSIELIVHLFEKKKINKDKAKVAIKIVQQDGWFHSSLIEKALEDIEHERS